MSRKRAVYVITREQAKQFNGRRAWSGRYDLIDATMNRPVHAHMSVAPPWATRLTRGNRYAPEGPNECDHAGRQRNHLLRPSTKEGP